MVASSATIVKNKGEIMCHSEKIAEHEILENRKIAEDYYLMTLKCAYLQKAQPGQFYMLSPKKSNHFLSRPISLFSQKSNGDLQFYYFTKGSGTLELSHMKPGEKMIAQGPLGNSFTKVKSPLLLVGGGVGLAPFYELIESRRETMSFELLAGARTSTGLEILKEFKAISPDIDQSIYEASDDGSVGMKGFVTELLIQRLAVKYFGAVFVCGPTPMMKAVAKICRDRGIQCFVSLEEAMACGVGACVGCSIETPTGMKRVCKEGPIFDATEVFYE